MLSSIHPLGERVRGNRWGVTVALHTVAAAAGGAAVGGAAGALGSLVVPAGAAAPALAALAGAAALLLDGTGRHRALALPRRQVDERWLTSYRRWVYAAGWGVQLGAGVVTVMPAATVWLVPVLALLTAAPGWGAAVGGAFGLVRGATLLAAGAVRDPASLRALHAALARQGPLAHRLGTVADGAVALAAVAALAR